MSWPSSARVLGVCGLAASGFIITGLLMPAGVVMAAANMYARIRG